MTSLKENELVSVIVNCYNGEKYLKEAIDSIINQTYKNIEIIFWDNFSTDQTQNIIMNYSDDRIRYYRGDKTVDVYKARNYALAKCNGDFIAFLDSDDYWYPNKLEKQMPLFDDENVGLVYSDSYFFNNNRILRRNYRKGYPSDADYFRNLLENYHLDIETVVLRRSILQKYNLSFNENFNCVGDADLFLKVAYHSKIKIYPGILAKWRIHEGSITHNQQDRFIIENKIMLDNLEGYLKNSEINYSKELNNARIKNTYRELFLLLLDNKPLLLRSKIRKLNYYNYKIFIFYLVSYVPYKIFFTFKKIIEQYKNRTV